MLKADFGNTMNTHHTPLCHSWLSLGKSMRILKGTIQLQQQKKKKKNRKSQRDNKKNIKKDNNDRERPRVSFHIPSGINRQIQASRRMIRVNFY